MLFCMITTQISCDHCGALKGATNHWFKIVVVHNGAFLVAPLHVETQRFDLGIGATVAEYQLCGRACVSVRVSELLESAEALKK